MQNTHMKAKKNKKSDEISVVIVVVSPLSSLDFNEAANTAIYS